MELKELETQLVEIHGEIKKTVGALDEYKKLGAVTDDLATKLKALQTQYDALDSKLVDKHNLDMASVKSVADCLKENEDVSRLVKNKKGRATMLFTGAQAAELLGFKTITTPTIITPAPVNADRGSLVIEARRRLVIRDALASRPTALPLVYWPKVNAAPVNASPQVEGSSKFENTVTFTEAHSAVKTLATFVRASRQALDDFDELGGYLRTGLPYYVNRVEETQLLTGDNTGENLNGLNTQATAFDVSNLSAASGYTRIDQIGAAMQQIDVADEIDPTFVILNWRDWWLMRRTKDGFGKYILGDPQTVGDPNIWGLSVIASNAMTSGKFLVGSGLAAASEIRDRMEMQVDISTEDGDNFTKNLITIRAEKRLVLAVYRPASYIYGTFATSPVSATNQ